jgi:hypothetical protein
MERVYSALKQHSNTLIMCLHIMLKGFDLPYSYTICMQVFIALIGINNN